MHKLIRLVVLLAVASIMLASAAPALADTPQETVDKAVAPVLGGKGPNAGEPFETPATVTIPSTNPAIGEVSEPGNVFWDASPF